MTKRSSASRCRRASFRALTLDDFGFQDDTGLLEPFCHLMQRLDKLPDFARCADRRAVGRRL